MQRERFRVITLAGKLLMLRVPLIRSMLCDWNVSNQAGISGTLKRDNKVSIYGVLPKDDDKTVFEQNLRTELGDDVQQGLYRR